MQPLDDLTAIAAPFADSDIDTDQIVPARFLSRPRDMGFAECLFHDLRYTADGEERAGFVLNRPAYKCARILVADGNFGCGSAREQAVYALSDYGFRAVIAPSMGDIFRTNCFQNGLAPIILPKDTVTAMLSGLLERPGACVGIKLAKALVQAPSGAVHPFTMDRFQTELLLEGRAEIDVTLGEMAKITAFEARHRIW
ncbi:MAG: 3-isopropylmalate dehydratase small subunit [Acetobacteraceae bacterium]